MLDECDSESGRSYPCTLKKNGQGLVGSTIWAKKVLQADFSSLSKRTPKTLLIGLKWKKNCETEQDLRSDQY